MIRPLRANNEIKERPSRLASPNATAVLTAGSSSTNFTRGNSDSGNSLGPVLALSGSGMHQFEFGLDEPVTAEHNLVMGDSRKQTAANAWALRIMTAIAIIGLTIGGVWTLRGGRLSSVAIGPKDVLLLTTIQDKTGEGLGGAVLEGLELSLAQSRILTVRSEQTYQAGLRQLQEVSGEALKPSPRVVAQRVGAKAYLFGEIFRAQNGQEGSPYVIRVDALNAESNDRLLSLTEQAESRREIPAAIDRLSRSLRSKLGEGKRFNRRDGELH